MTRSRWGQGPPQVITEVWGTPPLDIAVIPRGVEVAPALGIA